MAFKKIISLLMAAITFWLPCQAFAQSMDAMGQQGAYLPQAVDPNATNQSTGQSFGSDGRDDLRPQDDRLNPFSKNDRPQNGMSSSGMGLTYQVHILGEVRKPGTYRILASTRLSEALQLAGGLLERGSERRIELRRREGGGRRVDLLSFKQRGNLDANPYLLDNDVVFVPLLGKVVDIEGAVKRPGFYELISEKSIEAAIQLAGGFTEGSKGAGNLKVIRFENGRKELIDVENEPSSRRSFVLKNADSVVVPHIFTNKKKFDYNIAKLPGEKKLFYPSYEERVFVLGAVARPGAYTFSPYYDVRQYLTLAGGTNKLAKLKKIKVIDAEGKSARVSNTTSINPGDTIVVPERYMAPENLVSLLVGIASTIVGTTAVVVSLTKD